MWWPSVRVALQTLRANPLRTALSTLGIIMGAASLAAVLAIGDGAEALARQRLEREGMQVVVLTPKTVDLVDGQRVPRQDVVTLGGDDLTALATEVGGAYGVSLARRGTVRWQRAEGAPLRAAALLGQLGAGAGDAPALVAGRHLRPDELNGTAPVALASHALAAAVEISIHGVVGREIRANGRAIRIVGVLAAPPGGGALELVVPHALSAALMVPARDPIPPWITVRAPRVEDVPALRARVDAWARTRYGDRVAVASRGLDTLRDLAQAILVFKLIMGAFTAISLVVGGIGIMNVLLSSVIERTREIGIRKAIGARQRDVVLQFLTESVTIALAGSLVGLSLGLVGAVVATALIRANTQATLYAAVSWQTVVVSLAAAVLTGLCFGVYPALRAARLSPVDAMRYE